MSSRRSGRDRRSRQGRAAAPGLDSEPFGEDRPNPKTLQLCRQVQRRLDLAFGGELDDPVLQGLWVRSVVPEPGGRSLLVAVVVDHPGRSLEVLEQLGVARGLLRSEVAAALTRKRTPYLHFIVLPPDGPEVDEGGDDDAG